MMRTCLSILLVLATSHPAVAAILRVPQNHKTIQAAIDASSHGDTIVVAPGKYQERIQLKPGIILRSEGDDAKGTDGLKRAEATIIDGGGKEGKQPGVVMAEGSTLDGFTITNVGEYDEANWRKHFDSQGDELGDEEGSVQAEGTNPAISIQGVSCIVNNCIIHHNGDVGIGILGKEKKKTAPLITDNLVYRSMGGGIGVAEEAEPIIRGNTCKENLRAGIGIRMEGTAPIVEGNECYENDMAGIGCRDGASPIIRSNVCRKNKMAGIGCRDRAKPLIVGNECRENELVGIGVQQKAAAIIQGNMCFDNKLVAIGVIEESTATITDNELSRSGGMPPLIAVKDGSTATIQDNRITGGGVAAVLVQGKAMVSGNTFARIGARQGNAVWVWEKSTATISDNLFDGYRTAVNATKATVVVTGNSIKQFQGTAIVVKDSPKPAHVYGNTASAADPTAKVVDVQGPSGVVEENLLKRE